MRKPPMNRSRKKNKKERLERGEVKNKSSKSIWRHGGAILVILSTAFRASRHISPRNRAQSLESCPVRFSWYRARCKSYVHLGDHGKNRKIKFLQSRAKEREKERRQNNPPHCYSQSSDCYFYLSFILFIPF